MFKAARVGVAPGTSTVVLGHTVNCPADAGRGNPGAAVDLSWLHAAPPDAQGCIPVCVGPTAPPSSDTQRSTTAIAPRSATTNRLSPYGTFEEMSGLRGAFRGLRGALRGALGLILNPFGKLAPFPSEIAMNRQSYGAGYCGPFDAQFNTRGEQGFYYDTPLGGGLGTPIPTDMQMSRVVGYTPYMSGWVNFRERSWAGPWVPPDGSGGANGVVAWGPPVAGLGRGLREATDIVVDTDSNEATAVSAIDLLKKHQDRTYILSVFSTLAVASTAALAWWRYRQEQHEKRKKSGASTQPAQSPNPILGGLLGRHRRRRRSRR